MSYDRLEMVRQAHYDNTNNHEYTNDYKGARFAPLFVGIGLNAKKNYSWHGKDVVVITLTTAQKRLIMFQNLGGLIGDLIPFCIFLYLTLVLYGVIKLEKKPEIFDNPPKYYKVIALLGLIAFAISIILKVIK